MSLDYKIHDILKGRFIQETKVRLTLEKKRISLHIVRDSLLKELIEHQRRAGAQRHLEIDTLQLPDLPPYLTPNQKNSIFSNVIGLRNSYFPTNSLSKYVVMEQFVIGQFIKPITFKVVVEINQSHSKL